MYGLDDNVNVINEENSEICNHFEFKGKIFCFKLFRHTENDISTDYLAVGGEKNQECVLMVYEYLTKKCIVKKLLEENR